MTDYIALDVFSTVQHRIYAIRFATEAQALAWWDAHPWTLSGPRSDVYVVSEAMDLKGTVEINEIDHPTLFARLYPTCEHGMDGRHCSGPNHFGEPGDPGWN